MLYTFRDTSFDDTRVLRVELSKIYGIGLSRSNYISSLVGLAKSCRVGAINYYLYLVLIFLLKQFYGTDIFLKRMRENNLKDFLAFKTYRSVKFAAGLPIRGQRTRTNARTTKSLKYLNRKVMA